MSHINSKLGKIVLSGIAVFACVGLLVTANTRHQDNLTTRKQSICPALLSISRSARDTLIVMKAEGLCNSYVLDNLK